ncbi:MAG: signal recognition particle receptor subunit alpha, partial [Candidatus ainarchaeum sp.]|nr:signal recognition particle receptor subunit alpha [Candidatus ainarchaeum sp.]
MFDFLKKKIGGFIDGLTKKEEKKVGEERVEEIEIPIPQKQEPKKTEAPKPAPKKEPEKAPVAKPEAKKAPVIKPEIVKPTTPKQIPPKPEPEKVPLKKPEPKPALPKLELPKVQPPKQKFEPEITKAPPEPKPIVTKPIPPKRETEREVVGEVVEEREREAPAAEPETEFGVFAEEEKPKERIKLGILGTVKSIITREVEISEGDVKEMIDGLELELLEADVEMGVAEGISQELRGKLIGSKIAKGKLHSFVSDSIKETLVDVLTNEKSFDIVERVEMSEKPIKMMFIGINGAGKTTTIAKVAKLLMNSDKKVVFAAADTFRAAAIEQMSVHADRLGVKVIKRDYGSDPTSVAYDAVNYAKAHGIDAVLIDTAGRQDTNISLINEMKKMRRVI